MQATILRQLPGLLRSQWRPEPIIAARQSARLLKMLRYAASHVPYYRSLGLREGDLHGPQDLQRFPILEKRAIQLSEGGLIADGVEPGRLHWSRTSGSTGEPTITYFDDRSWALCKYSLKMRRMAAMASPFFRRVLLVSEQPPIAAQAYAKSRPFQLGFPYRERTISLFDDMAQHQRVIAEFRPDVIYAFPSYFTELQHAYARGSSPVPRVRWLCTSSELLPPKLRQDIAHAFRGKVFDVYGCTEFKEVAWQCREGSYHINVESVYVETVPDEIEDGAGQILLTTVCNRAMPLIRFATGDRGALLDGRCSCGRRLPRIRLAAGRTGEMIVLPSGRRISPYVLTTLIETLPEVVQYRIRHLAPDHISIDIVGAKAATPAAFNACQGRILHALGESLRVELRTVAHLLRHTGGKHSVYVREW